MASVNDDCKAVVRRRFSQPVALGCRLRRPRCFSLDGKRLIELPVRRGRQIGNQPVARGVLVGQNFKSFDGKRTFGGQHQPRRLLVQMAVAYARDQSPLLHFLGIENKSGIRQVDHKSVRRTQQKEFRVRFAVEVEHHTGMHGIARHLVVSGLERRRRQRRQQTKENQQKPSSNCQNTGLVPTECYLTTHRGCHATYLSCSATRRPGAKPISTVNDWYSDKVNQAFSNIIAVAEANLPASEIGVA